MKKIFLVFALLVVSACSNSQFLPNPENVNPMVNANVSKPFTAKSSYPMALKEAKKTLSAPKLFEIDVWQETNSDTIQFGFMQKIATGDYKFVRIILDLQTNVFRSELSDNGGKIPKPVDVSYWKKDHDEILKIARDNGLKDQTFLATLWEDTWHISGLKQNLYFQIDSQNGSIRMICTDPYLQQCTDANLNPITPKFATVFSQKLAKK